MAARKRYGRLGGGSYSRAELAERGMYKRELYAHESVWDGLDALSEHWEESRPEAFARLVEEALEREGLREPRERPQL